jgi:hypothetical protein
MHKLSDKKRRFFFFLACGIIAIVCGFGVLHGQSRRSNGPVILSIWRLPSGAIFFAEDTSNSQLQAYRKREHLDDVVRAADSDFLKILTLAQWTSRQFVASQPAPRYPPWNAQIILDWIRGGVTGGYCAQYAFVFGQACQSLGYQPRYLDIAAPDGARGGHFTTEIYVPSLKRWIVFEPEWGYYYADKQGRPLDALDLHRLAVGQRKETVYKLPTKEKVDPQWLKLFYYFRYYLRNNFLSVPVFIKTLPTGQILFERYRLAWKDAYTDNQADRSKALFSSDTAEFRYPLKSSDAKLMVFKTAPDLYRFIQAQEPFTVCRFSLPKKTLSRMVEGDFVRDSTYHPLEAE